MRRSRTQVEEPPTLLYVVKQVELAQRARLAEVLQGSGITVLQYTAMTVLQRRGPMSSAALARSAFVTAQSMADLVKALGARGLVERGPDPADRRHLLVRLTEAGRDLLDRYAGAVERLEADMVADLTPQQVAALRTYLNSCRAALVP
ncbi:MarR family winged helix-turn-helix transcriptional regulator [Georgenia alba]|uniref:MarR family winged helix-turn-helix transcriptional regulator n=1 Tax=Georgenia alba TaxID=2233858 RepID=A0ABW2QH65_9MICO